MITHRHLSLLALSAIASSALAQAPIESRGNNTTLLIPSPLTNPAADSYRVERVFPLLTFSQITFLEELPNGTGRLVVGQKTGQAYSFPNIPNPTAAQRETFITISVATQSERGLLDLAFDPDYASNGHFYVHYSRPSDGDTRLSRFVDPNPSDGTASGATETILLEVDQPFSNHNGGALEFGPDGMLYLGLGDGGSANDPLETGQNPNDLLGSVLRLDVRGTPETGLAYGIPDDNPFVGAGPVGARDELHSYGLRNPWKISFDQRTGELWIADVGQGEWEEVNRGILGANYGWDTMEGHECFEPSSGCNTAGLTMPVAVYNHSGGQASITGGYTSYGSSVPQLYGHYIYGDFVGGRIWAFNTSPIGSPVVLVNNSGLQISSFGQDSSGEVYICSYNGQIHQLRPRTTGGGSAGFPVKLSDLPALLTSGLGQDQTAQGIFPYRPNAVQWKDGAVQQFFFATPGTQPIGFSREFPWTFPDGSILVHNYLVPMDLRDPQGSLRRVETRMMLRHAGTWHGYSYEWNETETDADLRTTSASVPFTVTGEDGLPLQQEWHFAGPAQCSACDTELRDYPVEFTTAQLNGLFTYPATGVTGNQVEAFQWIGLLNPPLTQPIGSLPRQPNPFGTDANLQDRAHSYLAANCSMCHQPGSGIPTELDLRWLTHPSNWNAVNVEPQRGDLGIEDALLIAPGEPHRSVLLQRVISTERGIRMPPNRERTDEAGVALLTAWIEGLQGTPSSAQSWLAY